ncbi:MAG: hypothetical protein N3C63_07710 [Rhodocyclaceae bacterium]|nr:hypothetical protein [Rhodocyclaceae bacterium]
MSRWLRLGLLVLALQWAQLALAEHGLIHALEAPEAPCATCLSLPGFAALPCLPLPPLKLAAPALSPQDAVQPAPSFAVLPFFRSRAPPEF